VENEYYLSIHKYWRATKSNIGKHFACRRHIYFYFINKIQQFYFMNAQLIKGVTSCCCYLEVFSLSLFFYNILIYNFALGGGGNRI